MRSLDKIFILTIFTIRELTAFLVAESSSRLAFDSCAEPRAPAQALFTEGANEGPLALALCFVCPEHGKFRNRMFNAVVPILVPLLLNPRVKPAVVIIVSWLLVTRGNLPGVELIEAVGLPSLLDIHVGAIEVVLLRL